MLTTEAAKQFDVPLAQMTETPVLTHRANILDFNRDLYGEQIEVEFVDYLRAEQRFESIDALIAQIHSDIQTARKILATQP